MHLFLTPTIHTSTYWYYINDVSIAHAQYHFRLRTQWLWYDTKTTAVSFVLLLSVSDWNEQWRIIIYVCVLLHATHNTKTREIGDGFGANAALLFRTEMLLYSQRVVSSIYRLYYLLRIKKDYFIPIYCNLSIKLPLLSTRSSDFLQILIGCPPTQGESMQYYFLAESIWHWIESVTNEDVFIGRKY